MISITFIAVIALVAFGLYAAMFKRNLVKIVIGINIIASAANLFLISQGYRDGGIAPIFTLAKTSEMVLATPQALVLTSIVISLALSALMLSLAIRIYRNYGSLDSTKRRLKE